MYAKKRKCPVVLLIVLALAVALLSGAAWLCVTHIFVAGKLYPKDTQVLNLREAEITVEQYEKVREELPEAEILWNVPFQGGYYPDDTAELTIRTLPDEDAALLAYFTELETIHAEECEEYDRLVALQENYPECRVCYTVPIDGTDYAQDTVEVTVQELTDTDLELLAYLPQVKKVNADECQDYDRLLALQSRYPQCAVSYRVTIGGTEYGGDTTELTLENPDLAELTEKLAYLPGLKSVMLQDTGADAESLLALREAYPDVAIDWQVEVLGLQFSSQDADIDLSSVEVTSTDVVEEVMAYFPDAEKVFLGLCGLDNDELAAFREEKRPEYKVAWEMPIGYMTVRTDDTWFMPGKYKKGLTQDQAYYLRYCEDMICIDIGHKPVQTIEWVEFMPHLKYLILAHTSVKDITPLSNCKELIYLEIDWTAIRDYSPLLGCTALEDLNLGKTYGDIEPITQMTWLKNLWWKGLAWDDQPIVREALPNTNVQCNMNATVGNGWRKLQNYYDMRDILGMYYMNE